MKKLNKKGFTLAELLIVVAIIAVLVAIAIPVFTSQLEKAKEATDAANLRAAYAEVTAAGLTGDKANYEKTVTITQGTEGWVTTGVKIGNKDVASDTVLNSVKSGDTVKVTYTPATTAGGTDTVVYSK